MARHGKRPSVRDVFRAANTLELPDLALAQTLRCSGETVTRYRLGGDLVQTEPHTEMAQGLVEVCGLIPGFLEPGQTPAQWLRAFNKELDAVPLHVLEHEWGLDDLLAWLRGEGYARSSEAAPSGSRRKRPTRRPTSEHEPPSAAASKPKPEPKADRWWAWIAGGTVVAVAAVAGFVAWNRR